MTDIVTAATEVAELFVQSIGFGLAEHLSCSEADSVAALLVATGSDAETVLAFLSDHASSDDEGDRHLEDGTHRTHYAAYGTPTTWDCACGESFPGYVERDAHLDAQVDVTSVDYI